MTMNIGGKDMTVAVPRMTMTIELKTVDKRGSDYQFDGKVTEATVDMKGPNAPMRQVAAEVGKLKGLRMAYWMDPRGYIHDVQVDAPKDLPASMQQTLSSLTQSVQSLVMPLPVEAVGAGARWQALMRTTGNGLDLVQSVWITLQSRTAKTITLDMKLKQLAASDHATANGIAMTLHSVDSSGTGTIVTNLADAIADRATMNMALAMDIEAATTRMKMGVTMGMGVSRP
jgi:hypothetical protein